MAYFNAEGAVHVTVFSKGCNFRPFSNFTEVHAHSYSSCPVLFLHSHYMCFLNQVTSRHVSAFLVNLHTRIPYIGKLLREKTFTNWWIAQVLANYGYGHRLIITSHTYVLSMIQPLAVTVVGHVLPIKFSWIATKPKSWGSFLHLKFPLYGICLITV